MRSLREQKKFPHWGFTLIELLVIAISSFDHSLPNLDVQWVQSHASARR